MGFLTSGGTRGEAKPPGLNIARLPRPSPSVGRDSSWKGTRWCSTAPSHQRGQRLVGAVALVRGFSRARLFTNFLLSLVLVRFPLFSFGVPERDACARGRVGLLLSQRLYPLMSVWVVSQHSGDDSPTQCMTSSEFTAPGDRILRCQS